VAALACPTALEPVSEVEPAPEAAPQAQRTAIAAIHEPSPVTNLDRPLVPDRCPLETQRLIQTPDSFGSRASLPAEMPTGTGACL
jgi:hypothetical protein